MLSKPNNNLITKLLFLVVGMFAFGFVLVPLYNVFCDITGTNGKVKLVAYNNNVDKSVNVDKNITKNSGEIVDQNAVDKNIVDKNTVKRAQQPDSQRKVTVQFAALNNNNMPWIFKPEQTVLTVVPGEAKKNRFIAENPQKHAMTAQAIPSVSPSRAAKYFHKTQCFCFDQQELQAGEKELMGLEFVVDKELPEDIHTITLTYTLFDITKDKLAKDKVAAR